MRLPDLSTDAHLRFQRGNSVSRRPLVAGRQGTNLMERVNSVIRRNESHPGHVALYVVVDGSKKVSVNAHIHGIGRISSVLGHVALDLTWHQPTPIPPSKEP